MPYLLLVSSSCSADIFNQGAKLKGDKYVCWIVFSLKIKAILI